MMALLIPVGSVGIPDIRHVVVVMEENRAFDHVFGHSATPNWPINGLTGKEFNLVDTTDPASRRVYVSQNATFLNPCDPNHGTPATTQKIYPKSNRSAPTMGGFVEWEAKHGCKAKEFAGVMEGFGPADLPVINELAREYAIFDHFFCSHPGPTWPNRMYMLSGTSAGSTETSPWYRNVEGQLFPQRTIFHQLAEQKRTWKNYYNDTPWEMFMEAIAHNPQHTRPLTEFFHDASAGTLPSFSWINPSSGINTTTGVGSSDQHPDHDMRAGEQLIKALYEAVRAGPGWNHTLFVVTYDEHGGFFDHVPPPEGVPPPGDHQASYPDRFFRFDRLGVRIPTIVASPWIPRGRIESEPPKAQRPRSDSQYELTSIIATARKLLRMEATPLTDRDGWAATFEHLLSLDAPRTDCPMHLPDAHPPASALQAEGSQPLNELQLHIGEVHARLAGEAKAAASFGREAQLHHGPRVSAHRERHVQRQVAAAHERSRDAAEMSKKYNLLVRPRNAGSYTGSGLRTEQGALLASADAAASALMWPELPWACERWNISKLHPSLPWVRITTLGLKGLEMDGKDGQDGATKPASAPQSPPLCMDYGPGTQGTVVNVASCGPGDGSVPHDGSQRWIWDMGDVTLRPFSNASLCLTNHVYDGGSVGYRQPVTLEPCDGAVAQHWAYHGQAPGNNGNGAIMFGDDANVIGLVRRL